MFLRFGVHLARCGVAAFAALFVYLSSFCQRAAEDGFCGGLWSVSGDGHSLRCCTVGELLRDCDLVSVRAVREECDEKEQGVRFGLRARPAVTNQSSFPLRYSCRSLCARRGHPQLFRSMFRDKRAFPVKGPNRPRTFSLKSNLTSWCVQAVRHICSPSYDF